MPLVRPRRQRPASPLRRRLVATIAGLVTLGSGLVLVGAPAQANNVATPGNFTGYGFDQCLAPSQKAMDAWLYNSPFWAVGIYISGDSRACPVQPNLTPTWVSTQLANGWRLLPITLGPQASCTSRDRYLRQVRINPDPTSRYRKARAQGRAEAVKTVGRSTELGIAPGSTLWYDLEGDFRMDLTDCRESALSFLSAWTKKLHRLGYLSGFYSSAGTGVKMLDDAATLRPGAYAMPDQLWVARWSGTPGRINEPGRTPYLRDTSWTPHKRVHQYRGGHNETHGGVTINIDSNFVDLGTGSTARTAKLLCGGVDVDHPAYPILRAGSTGDLVKTAQCLLRQKNVYAGPVSGTYDTATADAAKAFRAKAGLPTRGSMTKAVWTSILARGHHPLMKYGAANHAVRRLQRSLNAATNANLQVTGVFEGSTAAAVQAYQAATGLARTGVVTDDLWTKLRTGTL